MAQGNAPVRLKKRSEFLAVAASGNKFVTRSMVLQFLRHPSDCVAPALRVGFTVSKKQGGSVERNRIRRRLREAVRLTCATRNIAGWDLVVIGRRSCLELPFPVLMEDMAYAFGKLAKLQSKAPSDAG